MRSTHSLFHVHPTYKLSITGNISLSLIDLDRAATRHPMRPERRQFGHSLLVRIGIQVLLVNLIAFFICFSLLPYMAEQDQDGVSSGMQRASGGRGDLEAPPPAYTPRVVWVKNIQINDKTRALPHCYASSGGVPRPFSVTEWTAWKQRSAIWFQEIGLTGFIGFAEALLALHEDGTFAPLYEGASRASDILIDHEQQRFVLMTLSSHVWNIQDIPSSEEIRLAPREDIEYQFKAFSSILYRIFAFIMASSVPDKETGLSVYSEVFNAARGPLMLTAGTHHPLAAPMCMMLLNSKFKSDPSGSTKDMEDTLQLWVAFVSKGPSATLDLWNIREFLAKLHEEYYAIADRDKDGVYSLNRNLQESVVKGIQFTCLRAEKDSSDDLHLAAARLRDAVTKLPTNLEFSAFYTKLMGLCSDLIPTTHGVKTALPTVASMAGTATRHMPASSMAMVSTPSTGPPGSSSCCSGVINDAIKTYGMAAVAGTLKLAGTQNSGWMCENCCDIGHKSYECKSPAHPQKEQKLKAHREERAAASRKLKARRQAQNSNKPAGAARGGADNNTQQRGQTGAQGGNNQRGNSNQRQVTNGPPNAQTGRDGLRVNFSDSRNVRPRHQLDEALAAFPANSSNEGRFREVSEDDGSYGMSSHLAFPKCTTPVPEMISLPIILLLAITGLLASQVLTATDDLLIGLITVLLPVACSLCILIPCFQASTPTSAAGQPIRPRRALHTWVRRGGTATLITLAVLLHFFVSAETATPRNSSFAYMTAADRLATVLIDTGCSKTVFCSTDHLVNVRPLNPPVSIGGVGPGSITAYHVGDYPLTLIDEQGCRHMRIMKDCMVSPSAQANLLSHNDLRSARIGILVPDNETDPAMLFWTRRGGAPDTKAYCHMGCKHGLIPLPRHDGQLSEISEDVAAYLAITGYAFGSTHHQLRPLTLAEKWHHRLNHAHPSKIAKLSHNCIGMSPLAEFQVPCHDCMDANIRRSDLPPASQRTNTGVWNADMIDIGAKNLTI